MKTVVNVILLLLLCLTALQPSNGVVVKNIGSKPVSEDFLIIEIVLKHFASTSEGSPFITNREATQIILDNRTPEKSGFLMESQLSSELSDHDCAITADLRENLRTRNTGNIFIGNIKTNDKSIIVGDFGDFPSRAINLRSLEKAKKIYPLAKFYISAFLPGYSEDKNQAVFRFFFGPNAHAASATYLLRKRDQHWVIECYFTSFYA